MQNPGITLNSEDLRFALQKSANAIHEALAIAKIMVYWARRGFRVNVYYNEANDLATKRLFDFKDSRAFTWEVKTDNLWNITGNVYIELQALSHSQADFYLIFAGLTFVIPKSDLLNAINALPRRRGGDDLRSEGALLRWDWLKENCEIL